jgi:colicin import membrane protein
MSATKNTGNGIGGSPYQVPPEPNRWPSIGLAVGMHALLLAFLVVGINWQNNQPIAVEAEVWDMSVQTAAPPAPTPPPQVEPEPEPETPPPPTPRVVEPPKVEEPAPPKQPDIALEREKKRKEELKRKEQEEKVERERELAQQKREQEKKDKALADKKAREEAEKKELAKQEEADKKKKAEKEKADKEKAAKDKAEKLAKEKAEKAENAKLAKLRDDEMKRMMAGAGNPGSTGSAEKSTGPRTDKGYTAAITAKVKGNTSYAGSVDEPGNPTATFRVEQLPTGEIISVRKVKSSGVPSFDDAVEKGINKSSPLPKKKDGTVERTLEINFHMKDLQ